jgi:hypothetical protein
LCIFNPVGDPLSLPKNMPVGIVILITTVIAGGLGWLIGWWMRRNRPPTTPSDLRLENELRWHLAQREAEVVMKRDQLTQTMTSLATALANRGAAERETEGPHQVAPFWRTRNTGGEIDSPLSGEFEAVAKRLPADKNQTTDPDELTSATDFNKPLFMELK